MTRSRRRLLLFPFVSGSSTSDPSENPPGRDNKREERESVVVAVAVILELTEWQKFSAIRENEVNDIKVLVEF